MRALDDAHGAVHAGDLVRALDRLLVAWRETPAEPIADAIAAVGRHAQRAIAPPSGRTARDRSAAWHALARGANAVTRGVLIDDLGETVADTLARIEILAASPSDPRFAAKLGDLVERPIYNAALPRTTAFWRRIFELLPTVGDPRLLVRARGFPATWAALPDFTKHERDVFPKRFARAMPALEAAYGRGVPVLDDASRATCAAIADAIRKLDDEARAALMVAQDARLEGRATAARRLIAEAAEGDLLAAIYAAPDDDDLRRDFAAWLTSRGDPRGEFITLQLERRAIARQKKLLAEHKTRWLGALAQMVKTPSATFERGFLHACELKGTWQQRLDDDPVWSTVGSIILGNAGMIRLATIARPLVIESIDWELRLAQGTDYGTDTAIAAFQRLRLPRLRRMRIWGDWFRYGRSRDWIQQAPVVAQLDELLVVAE